MTIFRFSETEVQFAKNLTIVLLTGMLVWFGTAVVRLEQYHSASMIGMCGPIDSLTLGKRELCLQKANTRTSALDDLLYGLGIL
jgi:hypothetical protein